MPPNALWRCLLLLPRSPPLTALLSLPSPVSPASLVMLHTSLLLHIATGSYFPHHPAGELRSQPGSRLPEHSPAARSPTRSRGWGLPAALPSPPGTGPEPPCPPGTCLSFPPRSISKMHLGDCFPEKYLPCKRLSRGTRHELCWELAEGEDGSCFKLYSSTRRTERDRGLLLGVWREELHVLLN